MYPYLNLGFMHLGTFGLLLWLAAVAATVAMHRNFVRNGVDADALNIVATVVVAGVIGAKVWHELEDVRELEFALRMIGQPGWHHLGQVAMGFLGWFRAGFAWFGGMAASIVALMIQGHWAHFRGPQWKSIDEPGAVKGAHLGAVRMLDLAAPATALGYGIGRIGCLLSGDGDYGVNTTLPWGVHMMHGADEYHRALVLPTPVTALVQPTPIYELIFSLAVFWLLWRLGRQARPVGLLTGLYLALSGVGRFLVEFVRINPKLYFHNTMSNAQVAALASVILGLIAIAVSISAGVQWTPQKVAESKS
jgi:phosphatidylglycerol:prolipoprotein diacylglycerol transferase